MPLPSWCCCSPDRAEATKINSDSPKTKAAPAKREEKEKPQIPNGAPAVKDFSPPQGSSTATTTASRGAAPKEQPRTKDVPGLEIKQKVQQQEDDAMSVASTQKSTARSRVSCASSVNSEFLNERIGGRGRASSIQQSMKAFVKSMIKGRDISVLSVDGQLRTCVCSLDRKLKNFIVEIHRSSRKIPLSSVAEVYQGTEPDDIDTPLDDLCATMMLDSGECISFRFGTVQERESFAMCLQIIVDGQH